MPKKDSLLDGILGALGESGGELLSELLGGNTENTKADSSLGGLFEGGNGLLEDLGDLVSDLTGIGTSNPDASPVAKQTGEIKSSTTKKKVIRSVSGKAAAKPTAKKTVAKKTSAQKSTPAASTAKKKSSSTKKKTV